MIPEWVSFCLSQLAAATEADACEFMRLGWAPLFGVWFDAPRWTARLVPPGTKRLRHTAHCTPFWSECWFQPQVGSTSVISSRVLGFVRIRPDSSEFVRNSSEFVRNSFEFVRIRREFVWIRPNSCEFVRNSSEFVRIRSNSSDLVGFPSLPRSPPPLESGSRTCRKNFPPWVCAGRPH